MQVHSLNIDDFCEDNYTLIGIHSTLEDYKLAYLLNKQLKTAFSKASFNLDFKDEKSNASFPVFSFKSIEYDSDWYLIANSFSIESTKASEEILFGSETKSYLIPEKKEIDFFFKITGDTNSKFIHNTINKIKNIQEVITSYSIDITTLKSKESLTF